MDSVTTKRFSSLLYSRVLLASFAGAALLSAGSWLSVPFFPVWMTLQTLAVYLLVLFYPPRVAFAAATLWVAAGLVTQGMLFSPGFKPLAFGYIAGMWAALGLLAMVNEPTAQRATWQAKTGQLLIVAGIIFSLGMLVLGGLSNIRGLGDLLYYGMVAYLPAEAVKIALVVLLASGFPALRQWMTGFTTGR